MISNIFAGLAGLFFAFAFAPEWFDGAILLAWRLSCAAAGNHYPPDLPGAGGLVAGPEPGRQDHQSDPGQR